MELTFEIRNADNRLIGVWNPQTRTFEILQTSCLTKIHIPTKGEIEISNARLHKAPKQHKSVNQSK